MIGLDTNVLAHYYVGRTMPTSTHSDSAPRRGA